VRFGAPDANGRRDMETIAGSQFTLDVDLVLLAMGFLGPVRDDMLKQFGVSLSERGNVATQGYATSVPRVYAAGDMRRGQSLVVWAIAEGREAAAQIDRDLSAQSR
jgi:glutamate synthase (NADPH) small chain